MELGKKERNSQEIVNKHTFHIHFQYLDGFVIFTV